MSKLVFGCGYLGRRVAQRWLDSGQTVFVVTRSTDRARLLQASGLRPILGDITDVRSLRGLPQVETVLFAVGFDQSAGQTIHEVYVNGLQNVLEALPTAVQRMIYISSTGVYGQNDGSWVDETSACEPRREGGRACLAAEQILAAHRLGQRAIVLRLAGLYGPNRIPPRRKLASRVLTSADQSFLNLIHVDDAAAIVLAVEQKAPVPRLYLVSDGNPVLRRHYYRELMRLFHIPQSRLDLSAGDSQAAMRTRSNKRIRNSRLMDEVCVTLRFPSYRDGLRAIAATEDSMPSEGSAE